jgi:hypothetical protein
MKQIRYVVILLFFFAGALAPSGQEIETETFLVPISLHRGDGPIPGAFGSLWTSTLFFRNETAGDVMVSPHYWDCGRGTCNFLPIRPGTTVELELLGRLITVEKPSEGAVFFNLRVRDISRQSQTWGTEIPVVSQRDFLEVSTTLLGVPATSEFRHTLRLYEVSGTLMPVTFVRVRVFGTDPKIHSVPPPPSASDVFLGEAVVPIHPARAGSFRFTPGYTEIHDLGEIASLEGWDLVTVQIEPVTEGLQYWAFISVTNNETQHVTTITPQSSRRE